MILSTGGACFAGGMRGRGGHAWQGSMCGRGACVAGGVGGGEGVCMTCMPPGQTLWLQHTVNERSVCILLECILVHWYIAKQ